MSLYFTSEDKQTLANLIGESVGDSIDNVALAEAITTALSGVEVDISDADVSELKQIRQPRETTTVTISSGETESSVLDCTDGSLIGIISPAIFDNANISFLGSVDGENFYPINYESSPYITTVGTLASAKAYSVIPSVFVAWRYIKLKASSAVAEDRVWICVSRALS